MLQELPQQGGRCGVEPIPFQRAGRRGGLHKASSEGSGRGTVLPPLPPGLLRRTSWPRACTIDYFQNLANFNWGAQGSKEGLGS